MSAGLARLVYLSFLVMPFATAATAFKLTPLNDAQYKTARKTITQHYHTKFLPGSAAQNHQQQLNIAAKDTYAVTVHGKSYWLIPVMAEPLISDNSFVQRGCALVILTDKAQWFGSYSTLGPDGDDGLNCDGIELIHAGDFDNNGVFDIGLASSYTPMSSNYDAIIEVISWPKPTSMPTANAGLSDFFSVFAQREDPSNFSEVEKAMREGVTTRTQKQYSKATAKPDPNKRWVARAISKQHPRTQTLIEGDIVQYFESQQFTDIDVDLANSFEISDRNDNFSFFSVIARNPAKQKTCSFLSSTLDENSLEGITLGETPCHTIVAIAFTDLNQDGNLDIIALYEVAQKHGFNQLNVVILNWHKTAGLTVNETMTQQARAKEHHNIALVRKTFKSQKK